MLSKKTDVRKIQELIPGGLILLLVITLGYIF
jgi:hypothetical protein